MSDFNMKLSNFSTILKGNPQKAASEIELLDNNPSAGVVNAEKHGRIRLSAAKISGNFFKSTSDFINRTDELFKTARDNNSAMLILPEFFSLMTIPIAIGGKKIFSAICDRDEPMDEDYFKEYMLSLGQWNCEFYLNTFGAFARKYNMYVQPGSVFVADGGKFFNRSYFFDNKGKVIGAQDKIFLTDFEKNLGISQGYHIHVVKTPMGTFTVLNDDDCMSSECAKVAKEMGANIIISTCISPDEETKNMHTEHLKWRCQEQNMFGIETCYSMPNTRTKCRFLAPYLLTENSAGILAETDKIGTKSYSISHAKLENNFDPCASDRNPYLYRKYFQEIYK